VANRLERWSRWFIDCAAIPNRFFDSLLLLPNRLKFAQLDALDFGVTTTREE
jgi:hypothetical protein